MMQPLPVRGAVKLLILLPVELLISEPVVEIGLSTLAALDLKAVVFVLMTVLRL